MFFAVNRPLDTLPAQIAQEFAALSDELRSAQSRPSLCLYALVDGAFDKGFFNGRFPRTSAPRSLYADTALQSLGMAAPHLLAAPDGKDEAQGWLRHLFSMADGKPMVSIIASHLSIEALALHLCPYLIAITPDTVEWPIRWGDTRVLPELLKTLPEIQRDHLLAPVRCWWSVGREGELLRWEGAVVSPAPAGFDKLPLSDENFTALVDAAEADSVLANIYDSQPDLFQADSPAECYARVSRHLELASENGIDAAPARQHFSALALILSADFARLPHMAELLRRTRLGSNYYDEIDTLPDDFWNAADR